jgi:hypothetical protein
VTAPTRALGYVARVEALPLRWETWQTVGRPTWDGAETAVRTLRRSGLDARNGGEWLFRREHANRGERALVQAKWLGTRCTGCGAASPPVPACPLCGCDKDGAP